MFMITVSWYVVDVLQHPAYLGLIMAAASLPKLVTMLMGGVLAGRIQKSQILFWSQLIKVGLIGILLFGLEHNSSTISLLLVISFFIGCTEGFFYPALSALVPSLVAKKELQPANTLVHNAQELLYLVGPVVAGALMHFSGFSATFIASIAVTLLSAFLISPGFIKDIKQTTDQQKSSLIKEMIEGYHYVRTSSIYIAGISIIIIINFFVFGPIMLALPILVKEIGGNALQLSFLEASFAAGTLTPKLLLLFFSLKKNRGKHILTFLMVSTLSLALFSQMPNLGQLITVAIVIGFFSFLTYIPTEIIIQEKTDPAIIGRVMGIVFVAATAFDPISQTLFSSLLGVGLSARALLISFALVGQLCLCWY